MPEYATFTISYCRVLCRFDSLSDCKILVIASQNLKLLQSLIGEADEVFDYILKVVKCILKTSTDSHPKFL